MGAVTVCAGGVLQNRFGVFCHADWVGRPFGSKVFSNGGVGGKGGRKAAGGFIHLLAPTPELWTLVLSHRTRILYVADISLVVAYLELVPGCVVLESGTGSGSLTTSLARAVAPHGRVFTFDFRARGPPQQGSKFIPEVIGKEIEKVTSSIFPLQNVFVRKVKILKAPKFDLGKLMEVHGDYKEDVGVKVDRPAEGDEAMVGGEEVAAATK